MKIAPVKIAVCALTYNRPAGLRRLLDGLNALTFRGQPPDLTIIIVDNDPEGSGRASCDPSAGAFRWPLKYVIEKRRGIAFARNAALDHVGDADWVGFIDDDEVPDPQWLDELLRVQCEYDADVVTGPVQPRLPESASRWITRGAFFDQRRYATGHRLQHAYTNNVIFRRAILTDLQLRFDHRWALMGCEDQHFFERIAMAGRKIIWADAAVVTEWIPKTRASARWILQRGYRYGNSTVCVERDLRPELRPHFYLLVRGAKRIARGLLFAPMKWVLGIDRMVTELRHICYGAGMFAGWFGLHYKEYRKTHGT